ncbi:MAG: DNA recombination protein RmuC [Clostridia bacterium]|nr:DNA recombination protein RmuC [Clostridia bacterium]
MMDYIVLALGFVSCVLLITAVVQLASLRRNRSENETLKRLEGKVHQLQTEWLNEQRASRQESIQSMQQSVQAMSQVLLTAQNNAQQSMTESLENIRRAVNGQMESIRQENTRQLEQMRQTVDEKLQKTLNDRISRSFELVNQRLEQVYEGLGEMRTLATGVGDLKKVLSNVKARGVLGEVQLGAILEQILSPEQYQANVKTKPGSTNFVEFAVKLPGADDGMVWLPIDAKFPGDAYVQLLDAQESGDAERVKAAGAVLEQRVRSFAKDIHDKYIDPPNTTDFAIMFLPTEGLYAEVVRRGMIETLQTTYHVNIAGPTTMAALLNSLQMGFRTLAIQKRSGEVWKVLGAVKTEFDKFGTVVQAAQQRLDQANKELDKLVGTRTRQIQRKLASVTSLTDSEAVAVLEDNTALLPEMSDTQ